ncbi:hypothetical protein RvY_17347 [Ramazzottius varieornatus]|uniref:Uncharacterized protein n=1 Tax=Ramazzottius varieornatus TaxID=947166 RepID=A0A1D1W286_RAMVA|nr:hypothetical protein RvY_17347 [Ramazzottius varieornatus]
MTASQQATAPTQPAFSPPNPPTPAINPATSVDQLNPQTGNVEASRTWTWTSEHLDHVGKNAPSFLV